MMVKVALLLVAVAAAANAKVYVWRGATNDWDKGSNWAGGSKPGPDAIVKFPESFSSFSTGGGSVSMKGSVSIAKLVLPRSGRVRFTGSTKLQINGVTAESKVITWASKKAASLDPTCPLNWNTMDDAGKLTGNEDFQAPCAGDEADFPSDAVQIAWPRNTFLGSVRIMTNGKYVSYSPSKMDFPSTIFQGAPRLVSRASDKSAEGLPFSAYCQRSQAEGCSHPDIVKAAEHAKDRAVLDRDIAVKEKDAATKELGELEAKKQADPSSVTDEQIALLKSRVDDLLKKVADANAKVAAADEGIAAAQKQQEEENKKDGPEGSGDTDKSSGLPIVPIAAGAGGGLLLIIIIVIVVMKRGNDGGGAAPTKTADQRTVVAFENPMYDDPGQNGGGAAEYDNGGADEGLYDEPAFTAGNKANPLYDSNEDLAGAGDDTGYLDVSPEDDE